MTVAQLIEELEKVEDKTLEVFVEPTNKKNYSASANGVYLVHTPVKSESLPNNCVVVNS